MRWVKVTCQEDFVKPEVLRSSRKGAPAVGARKRVLVFLDRGWRRVTERSVSPTGSLPERQSEPHGYAYIYIYIIAWTVPNEPGRENRQGDSASSVSAMASAPRRMFSSGGWQGRNLGDPSTLSALTGLMSYVLVTPTLNGERAFSLSGRLPVGVRVDAMQPA